VLLPAFVMLLHCAVFLFDDGDDGEGGTYAIRGRLLGMISSGGRDSVTEFILAFVAKAIFPESPCPNLGHALSQQYFGVCIGPSSH